MNGPVPTETSWNMASSPPARNHSLLKIRAAGLPKFSKGTADGTVNLNFNVVSSMHSVWLKSTLERRPFM